jgi:hypothetical protein
MLLDMSRSMLENLVAASDTMVRVFAVLAAISAIVYFFSSRQLQRANHAAATEQTQGRHSELQAELSSAQKRISELQSENTRLTGAVESERQARMDTQKRFGPRGVLPASATAMIETLAPFVGQKVNFAYFTELETAHFAERVLDVLRRAGWRPQIFKLKTMAPLYGVYCGGPNADDAAFKALSTALTLVDKHLSTQDQEAAGMLRSAQPQITDQLWIMVGLKRPHLKHSQPQSPAAGLVPGARGNEHGAVDRD